MPAAPDLDQRLAVQEDLEYTEPPKFLGLYVEATKWIVGLATGAFFILGTVLADKERTGLLLSALAVLAIVAMTGAAAAGVRALQGYTKLANLIELHAAKTGVETEIRNNGYEGVRWASKARCERINEIRSWLTKSNWAYVAMTCSFGFGLLVVLAYMGLAMLASRHESTTRFVATPAAGSDVLGLLRDSGSHSECLIVRSQTGLLCQPVQIRPP